MTIVYKRALWRHVKILNLFKPTWCKSDTEKCGFVISKSEMKRFWLEDAVAVEVLERDPHADGEAQAVVEVEPGHERGHLVVVAALAESGTELETHPRLTLTNEKT